MTKPALPQSGGSYTRDDDGKLERRKATEEPAPRAQGKPAPKKSAAKPQKEA